MAIIFSSVKWGCWCGSSASFLPALDFWVYKSLAKKYLFRTTACVKIRSQAHLQYEGRLVLQNLFWPTLIWGMFENTVSTVTCPSCSRLCAGPELHRAVQLQNCILGSWTCLDTRPRDALFLAVLLTAIVASEISLLYHSLKDGTVPSKLFLFSVILEEGSLLPELSI